MTRFGKYVVADVVCLTVHGGIFTARRGGDGRPTFAVKQYNSPKADPDEPHWDCQNFLDRARVQKSVIASGGRYWAPIHDMGLTAEGAWYVTDYHPLSADKLIDGKIELTSVQLHHIVDSVMRGLVELQEVRRRAHGSLKGGNVLIAGMDLTTAAVLLTDPAQGISEGTAGDLYALGNLIHQLVLHRPPGARPLTPVPQADEWERLGKNGRRWQELCQSLLSPQVESRPTLIEVSRILRELAPKKKVPEFVPRRYKRYLVPTAMAACVALVGALVGALVLAGFVASSRSRFAAAKAAWIDPFAVALSDRARREHYQSDSDLRRAIADFDGSNLAHTPADGGLLSNFSFWELGRLRGANAAAERIEQDLAPARWHRLADLIDLQQRYQRRGWEQPADYLEKIIAAARPREGANLLGGIERMLRVGPLIEFDSPRLEETWKALDGDLSRIRATQDRALVSFARSLRLSAATAVSLSDRGFDGIDRLAADSALAGQLAGVTRSGWPGNIDAERFASEVAAQCDLAHPTTADMTRWLADVPLYVVKNDQAVAAAGDLRTHLKQMGDTVVGSDQTDADRTAFDRDRGELASRIDRFSRTRFIEKEFRSGLFAGERDDLQRQIDSLQRYARPQTPADVLKSFGSLASASARIGQYWDSWKKSQLALPPRAEDRAQVASLKVRAGEMQRTLTELEKQLPPVPSDLSGPLRVAAASHRDKVIASLLSGINPKSPQLDPLVLAGTGAALDDWYRMLRRLGQDFPIRRQLLEGDDRPEEKWSLQAGFWDDPDVQQIVRPDLARLAAIRSLASVPREELIKSASSSNGLELAFESWRQLGLGQIQPAWPANSQELLAERDMRRRLEAMVANLRDPRERASPLDMIRQQGPFRWRRAVEQIHDEAALAAAWRLKDYFGVDAAQIGLLSARGRYNVWMWRVRQDLAGNDQSLLQAEMDRLGSAAVQLKDQPSAARLLAAMTSAGRRPFADQQPGDRFKLSILGAQPAIEFKRVAMPGGRAFYLAASDVSVGQFAAIVDAAGEWRQCRQLAWAYLPGQRDPRRGPRSWEWTDGRDARLAPPQLWLTTDQDNDFAVELRAERFNRMVLGDAAGGMPSERQPMQHVSAEVALWFAGLCGCRLPTAGEWQAAYRQFEKDTPGDRWNLRDSTWELQRAYVASARAAGVLLPWPDEGAFRPEDGFASAGQDGHSRPESDGTLFFRAADASGGTVFHHLVGNVAQYVCNASEAFEALPGRPSPQAIAEFAGQARGSLYVIGASALSAPELPVDVPLPLPHADQGYSDVGFRLAFTAPPRSLGEQLERALQGQTYIWPAPDTGR